MQFDILKTPTGFLKLWQIALSIITVSVTQGVDGFFFGNMNRTVFCGGVLVAALLVTPLLLVTFLTGHARDIQRAPFEMLFNAVMAVLMVCCGAVVINSCFKYDALMTNKASDAGKAAGSLAIVNGVFYGLDTYFARQNME